MKEEKETDKFNMKIKHGKEYDKVQRERSLKHPLHTEDYFHEYFKLNIFKLIT